MTEVAAGSWLRCDSPRTQCKVAHSRAARNDHLREETKFYFSSSNPVFTISHEECTHLEGLTYLLGTRAVAKGT